jgi:Tfp pilus assembly protein PilN
MNVNDYSERAISTLLGEHAITDMDATLLSQVFGLMGESGEVAEKFKKLIRDKKGVISEEDKAEIQEAKKLRMVLQWGVEIYALLLVFFFLLASLSYVLKMNLRLTSEAQTTSGISAKYAQLDDYDAKIRKLNLLASNLKAVEKNQIHWSNLFLKLDSILTPEIIVQNFSNKDWVIFLTGKSKTREALVNLREKLEKEACFAEVKFPLSNLVAKENVDFQLEFKVQEKCVK